MATIRENKNTWYARWYDETGKRIERTTKVKVEPSLVGYSKGQVRAAREKLRVLAQLVADTLERLDKGVEVDIERVKLSLRGELSEKQIAELFPDVGERCPSVGDFLRDWLLMRDRERAINSAGKRYRQGNNRDKTAVEQFLRFLGDRAKMPMSAVTREDVQDFIMEQKKRVADGTVGVYCKTLAVAFKRAVYADIIVKSPFSEFNYERKLKREHVKQAFTPEQVEMVRNELHGYMLDFFNLVLFTGGQRLGDIAGLSWGQVELMCDAAGVVCGRIIIRTIKTGKELRIPLIRQAYELLKRVREKQGRDEEFVFPVLAREYFRNGAGNISAKIGRALCDCGLREEQGKLEGDRRVVNPLTLHSLRATAVTELRDAGVPPDLCREIVGHDSEEIERIYYRTTDERKWEAMRRLGEI